MISPALTICDSLVAMVLRLAFRPFATSPAVLLGWSLRKSMMRAWTSLWRRRLRRPARAGAARGRSTRRTLRDGRLLAVVMVSKLFDLTVQPIQSLLHVSALSFERRDDLLHS